MKPNSSPELTSARTLASPAASRSENAASSFTGPRKAAPSLQANTMLMPRAITPAKMSPLLSNMDAPFDCRPALKARPSTANKARPLKIVMIEVVPLRRVFITFLPNFSLNSSNTRTRIHFQQPVQIDHQRQPVVVTKHADAVRHVLRRLFQ